MDVQLINPFIRATELVFDRMVGYAPVAKSPQAFGRLPEGANVVNAVILMDGGETGAAVLRFPPAVVFPVGTAIAGPGISLEDAHDAIGELANMVTGNAKRDLLHRLIHISVPRIAIGDEELGDVANMEPWLCVPFLVPFGKFSLSVSIREGDRDRALASARDARFNSVRGAATVQS